MSLLNNPQPRLSRPTIVTGVAALGLAASPVLAGYLISGKSIAEKIVTQLTQPTSLLLIGLIALGFGLVAQNRRSLGLIAILLGVFVWGISTEFIGGRVVRNWERQITGSPWQSLDPLDTVVVLGGGTSKRPDNAPHLNQSGDRVATAVRLYHRGLVKHLVTTGDVLVMSGTLAGEFEDLDRPSVQTIALWSEMGIPKSSIDSLGGQNTASEMNELLRHPEWWENKRCGLITSAFHMPRAIQLARARGMDLVPVPCDYRAYSRPLTPLDFVPDLYVLWTVHVCFKEWLGMRVGR